MTTLIDTSAVPCNLVISNTTKDPINLPIFPDNGSLTLEPDTQIVYKVETSREYLYYYNTCKGLGLSLAEQTSGSEE